MKVLNYQSQCKPQLNAQIMRSIEALVCRHRNILPNGWRCLVEFQYSKDKIPYYMLDIQSNQGGGDYAPIKMKMLNLFPDRAATGGDTPANFCKMIDGKIPHDIARPIIDKLANIQRLTELDGDYWEILSNYGLTHWYGGIRIPYDILVTEHEEAFPSGKEGKQSVRQTTGEIRIAFSGAKEWEDTLLAFCIFSNIQATLNKLRDQDQIWYNLRNLKDDPHLGIWLDLLGIHEA